MATPSVPGRPPPPPAVRRLLPATAATNHRPRVCRLCQKSGCLDVTEATFDLAGESYLLRDAYAAFASLIGSSVAASIDALHVCFGCTNELVAAYTFVSKVSAAEERLGTVQPVIEADQQQQQQEPDQQQQQQQPEHREDGQRPEFIVSPGQEAVVVVAIAEPEVPQKNDNVDFEAESRTQPALPATEECEEESIVAYAAASDGLQSPVNANVALVAFEPLPSIPDPSDQAAQIDSRTTTSTTTIPPSAQHIDCPDELDYLDHDLTEYIEEDEPAADNRDPAEPTEPAEPAESNSVQPTRPTQPEPPVMPYPAKITRHHPNPNPLKRAATRSQKPQPAVVAAKRAHHPAPPHPVAICPIGPATLLALRITSDVHTVLVPQYRLRQIDLATRPDIQSAAADGFGRSGGVGGPESGGGGTRGPVRTLELCARRLTAIGLANLATCDAVFTAGADHQGHEEEEEGGYYICSYCQKAFTRVAHLVVHTRTNHACHACLRTFEQVGELHQHMRREHPGARAECALCVRAFSGNSILRNHMRQVHGFVLPVAWMLLREAALPEEGRAKIVEEEEYGGVEEVLEEELEEAVRVEELEEEVVEDGGEFDDMVELMEEEVVVEGVGEREEEVLLRDDEFECIEEVF